MTEKFLAYLQYERNRSALTVASYKEDLSSFESYFTSLDDGLSWQTVDADIIRGWMESMMDRGNTASSVCRRLSAVRTFYRFALARGMVDRDPSRCVRGPKKEKPLPQFLKESDIDKVLDAGNYDLTNYEDVRDRAVIMTFYATGMRLSELTGLSDAAVDFGQCEMRVTGKRSKQRIIPFGGELRDTLRHYVGMRDSEAAGAEAFFTDADGSRLSPQAVRAIVRRRLVGVCSLKKLSPHVLRHTFATAMLNHGADLENVRQLLGHESLSTTEIYTHTTFEQTKRVYTNAHPRA